MHKPVVVVPNWNGVVELPYCLDSLLAQSLSAHIIVVDNGSADDSLQVLTEAYPEVEVIEHATNLGFAGGVNAGFARAIELGATYVATFNNDAVADKDWLKHLVQALDANAEVGIATCKLLTSDGKALDSTGEFYTVWGLPYPRGRGEHDLDAYDKQIEIFAASGGASIYRTKMLEQIGLFDEDFFAYYEDVDLSFRAQLTGWGVRFVPKAVAHHAIGATSGRIRGFTTYQTLKNLPVLFFKNVPRKYLWRIGWRLLFAQVFFFVSAVLRGHFLAALKGKVVCVYRLPRTLRKRRQIQATRTVSDRDIWKLIKPDLPPGAIRLRHLRHSWWKLTGRGR